MTSHQDVILNLKSELVVPSRLEASPSESSRTFPLIDTPKPLRPETASLKPPRLSETCEAPNGQAAFLDTTTWTRHRPPSPPLPPGGAPPPPPPNVGRQHPCPGHQRAASMRIRRAGGSGPAQAGSAAFTTWSRLKRLGSDLCLTHVPGLQIVGPAPGFITV